MFFNRIELCLVILIFSIKFSFAQKIENLRFEQNGKQIWIFYDLSGAAIGQLFDVQVFCSTDGGKTVGTPLRQISGDAGPGIKGGIGKKIIWDVLAERTNLTGDVLFELQAKKIPLTEIKADKAYKENTSQKPSINQSQDVKVPQKTEIINAAGTNTAFGSITDPRDSKRYKTIQIGKQIWMAENLNYKVQTGGWCYGNNPSNCDNYGLLYTWETAKTVCPAGWHLPNIGEIEALTSYLGGETIAGGKLKETGLNHWKSPNTGASNETSFSALPGGYRYSGGIFGGMGETGNWWIATETNSFNAWILILNSSRNELIRDNNLKASGFNVRCVKNSSPIISTNIITNIAATSATAGGNIISDGGDTITLSGICWGTSQNPAISGNKLTYRTRSGSYALNLIALKENTTYYVRAFATNATETSYGNQVSFKTLIKDQVSDIEGNIYNTVTIGGQLWFKQNLNTSRYNDDTPIPSVTDGKAWNILSGPGFCWYNNDTAAYGNTYGALYNWYAVNTGKLCPVGWRVPADADWSKLVSYLGGDSTAGSKLKETNTIHWNSPNTDASNETAFTALPGGYRFFGSFGNIGDNGNWWTSTPSSFTNAWGRTIYNASGKVNRGNSSKSSGFSVRCVKSLPLTLSTKSAITVSPNSAFCTGVILSEGEEAIISRGICWNTSNNPKITDFRTTLVTGSGTFTGIAGALNENTTYFARVFAVTLSDTVYGNQVTFTTFPKDKTIDVDGNTYNTVTIGGQLWFSQNLKTTRYNDGTLIPPVTDGKTWNALTSPGFCWYNNDTATYKDTYGALYNWYAVNTGKLCPIGWRVPTDADWTRLVSYLGGDSLAGGKLKEAGTNHWNNPNTDANNETSFTALPGGYRYFGSFGNIGDNGIWWSSTLTSFANALGRTIKNNSGEVNRGNSTKSSGLSVRCIKPLPLTVSTRSVITVTSTTAICTGTILSDGGESVTSRGVCWSTDQNPTTADLKTITTTGSGTFTAYLEVLNENTTYFARAFASTPSDTAYGNQISFKTFPKDKIIDIEGNVYNTVTIGDQLWMRENLKTSRYNDGTIIQNVSDGNMWNSLSVPAFCWYNNDTATYKYTYGALYNWYAVNTGKLCPPGWRIPSDADFTRLVSFLGGDSIAGSKLKEASTIHWNSPNSDAGNQSSFTALPGGYRFFGSFGNIGETGNWWSSTSGNFTSAWGRTIYNMSGKVNRSQTVKKSGLSLRCLKD